MNSPAVELIGRTIAGRYRLLRLVGEGGVGRVYEAEQTLGSSPRAVAVKLLRAEWSQDAAVVARFHREAALVARLQHPNTVRIYDFGATEDGTLFIAMEFLRGRSLQQLLDVEGALAPERVRRIVRQVAGSLQEAHDLGIVHRDLKPDNILIQESPAHGGPAHGGPAHGGPSEERDVVKLVDFGIAKGQPSSGSAYTKLTALGTFVGTPAYMSPEQFGGGNVGPQSDIYSLGVTSYYLLSGQLPFSGETAVQWAQAHLGTPAPTLAQDAGKGPIPESMRQAVARALSKDPAQRPASAAQFAQEFAADAAVVALPAPVAAAVPVAVPAPIAAEPAVLPGGFFHTAPMTRVPDFAQARQGRAVATTISIPAPSTSSVSPRAGAPAASRGARRGLWLFPLLVGVAAAGFALFQYSGQRIGFWPATAEPVQPGALSELGAGGAGEPAPVVIEPDPVPALPPPVAARAEPKPPAPPAARPPKPAPAGSPPVTPVPAPGVPSLPPGTLPGPAVPPGTPSPTTTPAPSLPTVPGLSLPIPLPTQLSTEGACQRCLDALEAGGNASVVNAMAQDLLCDDAAVRLRCEARARELAPDVAERAARAGDCPSALATEAAAVHLGVDPERFRAVNGLCMR